MWRNPDRVCKHCTVTEKKACSECGELKVREEFSSTRSFQRRNRICLACEPPGRACSKCGESKSRDAYCSEDMWQRMNRTCNSCTPVRAKECSECGEKRVREQFLSSDDWRRSNRVCSKCRPEAKRVGVWKCHRCKEKKPKHLFSKWCDGRKSTARHNEAWCNTCKDAADAELRAYPLYNSESVHKK